MRSLKCSYKKNYSLSTFNWILLVFILISCMHLFFKKVKFLPALLVLRMSMPFMVAAQTNEMTNGSLRPLPVVSDKIKSLRTTQIALADETPEVQTPAEVEEPKEKTKLYNMNVDTAKVQEAWLGWINYER